MKGLTYIWYSKNDITRTFNEIKCTINDKKISIPVVADIDPDRTEQLIDVINTLIQRELKLCE